jgi:hypothetical protein
MDKKHVKLILKGHSYGCIKKSLLYKALFSYTF